MKTSRRVQLVLVAVLALTCVSLILVSPHTVAQKPQPSAQQPSSYMSVNEEPFDVVRARDKANKAGVMAAQQKLLEERYNLSRRVDDNVRMTRGKPIPVGPTARLKNGVTWQQLGRMSPDEIRDKGVFPYLPLPHVNHPVGGMVFPQTHIKAIPRLQRFDVDFDLPDWFLPEFPAAMFLTTRTDLGDVSKCQLITINNYYRLFNA